MAILRSRSEGSDLAGQRAGGANGKRQGARRGVSIEMTGLAFGQAVSLPSRVAGQVVCGQKVLEKNGFVVAAAPTIIAPKRRRGPLWLHAHLHRQVIKEKLHKADQGDAV